jgi:ankyrin repeat protein
LHAACAANQIEAAALLLCKGADPNEQRMDGYSALHIAAARCNVELIKSLLQAGADLMAKTKEGCNFLHLIARHTDVSETFLKEIMQGHYNIQEILFQQNDVGHTPLHIACLSGNIKVISLIYFARYQEARVQDGSKPLHYKTPFI